jgi:hypothetical protein
VTRIRHYGHLLGGQTIQAAGIWPNYALTGRRCQREQWGRCSS